MSVVTIEAIEVDKEKMLPQRERSEWHCCRCAKCDTFDDNGLCNDKDCSSEDGCDCMFCISMIKVDADGYDDEQDYQESEADDEES